MEGLGMDELHRMALRADLLREIDKKADTNDVKLLAADISTMKLDQAERNRSLKESVAEVERAVKTLAQLVATQPGADRPGRFSFSNIDPRVLLIAGLAVGAAGGKAVEALIGGGF